MRTMRIAALLLVSAGLVTGAARSQSSDCPCPCPPAADNDTGGDPGTASIGYFHQQLSPYGRWVAREGYGEVWVPYVAAGWRPYTTGHWVYTDQGWAWVADESWGWAPFHYGRWFYGDGGWGWVPGTVWAPAWVAWRHGGGYVGWAALPPAVGFAVGVGVTFGGGFDLNVGIAPSYYSFVGESAILEPRLATVIVAPERNVTIIKNTTNITNYTVVNNRVVNNGVSVQRIQQVTGRPVPRVSTASQVGLYQPAVLTRAARVTKAENFTNRPAGNALGARNQTGISGAGTTGTGRRTTTTGAAVATTGAGRRGTTGTTGAASTTTGAGRRHSTGTTGTFGTSTGTGRRTTGTTGTSSTSTGTGHSRRGTGSTGAASAGTGATGSHAHGQTSSAGTPHPPPPHRNTGAGTPPPHGGQPNTHAAPPPPHRQKGTGTGTG
jgi:hypothetical protein